MTLSSAWTIEAPRKILSDGELDYVEHTSDPSMILLSRSDVQEPTTSFEQDLTPFRRMAALRWARSLLEPLRGLSPNWDSYGGLPVDPDAIRVATGIVAWLAIVGMPFPGVAPTPDGGISLEWHKPGLDFVVTVPPPADDMPTAYFFRAGGEEWSYSPFDPRVRSAVSYWQA